MKKVTIIQSALPHYRVAFFNLLRDKLARVNIELHLVHGEHPQNPTYVVGNLSWATPVKRLQIGPFSWHCNTLSYALQSDLVIVPQEIKHVVPLIVQSTRLFHKTRFAYWGHGKCFQSENPHQFSERMKQLLRNQADWWFAYNDLSARLVVEGGFPSQQTTSVRNSIDTTQLMKWRSSISDEELQMLRQRMNIDTENVAVFTGGMVPNKRLPFLIEALHEIKKHIPDFHMIFIGGGTERLHVTEAAKRQSWIHDIGPLSSKEIVPYWSISKLMLMPGLVGLVILDTFALGVPMITSDFPFHSPEIDYLQNGVNGMTVECGEDPISYAKGVVKIMQDPEQLDRLRSGALASAHSYSIENMAENFAIGVISALGC